MHQPDGPEREEKYPSVSYEKEKSLYLVGVWTTHLKNISRIGNLPQIGMKIKNVWNHHLVLLLPLRLPGDTHRWLQYSLENKHLLNLKMGGFVSMFLLLPKGSMFSFQPFVLQRCFHPSHTQHSHLVDRFLMEASSNPWFMWKSATTRLDSDLFRIPVEIWIYVFTHVKCKNIIYISTRIKLTIQKYLASITAVYPCQTMTPWKVQVFFSGTTKEKLKNLPSLKLTVRTCFSGRRLLDSCEWDWNPTHYPQHVSNKALMIQFSNDYPNARMPQKNTGLIFCSIWWLWLVS